MLGIIGLLSFAIGYSWLLIIIYAISLLFNKKWVFIFGAIMQPVVLISSLFDNNTYTTISNIIAVIIVYIIITAFTAWRHYGNFNKKFIVDCIQNEERSIIKEIPATANDSKVESISVKGNTMYITMIFDIETRAVRSEKRHIDIVKFPISKYASNNTYYAIENIIDGKKTRTFYTKERWHERIEDLTNVIE